MLIKYLSKQRSSYSNLPCNVYTGCMDNNYYLKNNCNKEFNFFHLASVIHLDLKTDRHEKLTCDKNNRKNRNSIQKNPTENRHLRGIIRWHFRTYFTRAYFFKESTYMSELYLHILATNCNKGQNKHKGKLHSSKVTAQHYMMSLYAKDIVLPLPLRYKTSSKVNM